MTRFCLTSLYVLIALIFASCRFAQDEDLVDYLRRQGGSVEEQGRLASPVAMVKDIADGSAVEEEEAELESGTLFYTGQTVRLVKQNRTVNGELVDGISVFYTLYKYDQSKKKYVAIFTNMEDVASETGLTPSANILESGIPVETMGKYKLEAYEVRSGYADSIKAVWMFQIGIDTVVIMTIELEDNYRLGYEVDKKSFSAKKLQGNEENEINVSPAVYKIKGKDRNGKEILVKVDIPDDLPEPTLSIRYAGDTEPITSRKGYAINVPNTVEEGANVQLRIETTYKGVTFDGSYELTIYE